MMCLTSKFFPIFQKSFIPYGDCSFFPISHLYSKNQLIGFLKMKKRENILFTEGDRGQMMR